MMTLPPGGRIHVETQPVDGRKGVGSLMVIVRDTFGRDPFEGHRFVFFSRRRDRVRTVYWGRSGFAMRTKRLEKGRFQATFANHGRFTVRCFAQSKKSSSRGASFSCRPSNSAHP